MISDKFVQQKSYIIGHNDFEKIVCEHYGIDEYDIVNVEEAYNNTTLETGARFGREIDEWIMEYIPSKDNPPKPYSLHIIMQDLCNKGVVPEGTIYIRVSR